MKLPIPNDDEGLEDFVKRCAADEAVKKLYPDSDKAQRFCTTRHGKWCAIAKAKKKKKKRESLSFLSGLERRFLSDMEIRIKDEEDAESKAITGYAAVFNSWSEDLGFFKEKITPGAFKKTIKENDIRALINHDPNLILGRTLNKTLRLQEDDRGLFFEVDLPETSYAADLRASIKRKDITQNSFGFQTIVDEWSPDRKRRILHEVKLFDISPVTFPAYKQTNVKLRLQEIGIDYEALNMALIRMDRDIHSDSDVDLVEATIQILRQYVPDPAEPLAEVVEDPEHSVTEGEPDLVSTLIRAR